MVLIVQSTQILNYIHLTIQNILMSYYPNIFFIFSQIHFLNTDTSV